MEAFRIVSQRFYQAVSGLAILRQGQARIAMFGFGLENEVFSECLRVSKK
jgi:hypothetical protein